MYFNKSLFYIWSALTSCHSMTSQQTAASIEHTRNLPRCYLGASGPEWKYPPDSLYNLYEKNAAIPRKVFRGNKNSIPIHLCRAILDFVTHVFLWAFRVTHTYAFPNKNRTGWFEFIYFNCKNINPRTHDLFGIGISDRNMSFHFYTP